MGILKQFLLHIPEEIIKMIATSFNIHRHDSFLLSRTYFYSSVTVSLLLKINY